MLKFPISRFFPAAGLYTFLVFCIDRQKSVLLILQPWLQRIVRREPINRLSVRLISWVSARCALIRWASIRRAPISRVSMKRAPISRVYVRRAPISPLAGYL